MVEPRPYSVQNAFVALLFLLLLAGFLVYYFAIRAPKEIMQFRGNLSEPQSIDVDTIVSQGAQSKPSKSASQADKARKHTSQSHRLHKKNHKASRPHRVAKPKDSRDHHSKKSTSRHKSSSKSSKHSSKQKPSGAKMLNSLHAKQNPRALFGHLGRVSLRQKGSRGSPHAKSSELGQVNRLLSRWQPGPGYAGQSAKVSLHILKNGKFSYKIYTRGVAMGFVRELKSYLDQLSHRGFGRAFSRSYDIEVDFKAIK